MLKEVQVVDDYTVKMLLSVPYAGFLHLLTPYRAGPIVNAKAVKDFGADFAWNPIGTGPYIFESRVPNRETVIVANDKYFGGAPPIKKIIFKTIPDRECPGDRPGERRVRPAVLPADDKAVVDRLKGKGFVRVGLQPQPAEHPAHERDRRSRGTTSGSARRRPRDRPAAVHRPGA